MRIKVQLLLDDGTVMAEQVVPVGDTSEWHAWPVIQADGVYFGGWIVTSYVHPPLARHTVLWPTQAELDELHRRSLPEPDAVAGVVMLTKEQIVADMGALTRPRSIGMDLAAPGTDYCPGFVMRNNLVVGRFDNVRVGADGNTYADLFLDGDEMKDVRIG